MTSKRLTRRTLLAGASGTGLAMAIPGSASAQQHTYAAFRVVRVCSGDPTRPSVTLPSGYEILPGNTYSVASRAEYYTFVHGPQANSIDVAVDWPGVPIRAVVHQDTRLAMRLHRDGVRFTLPMTTLGRRQPADIASLEFPRQLTGHELSRRAQRPRPGRGSVELHGLARKGSARRHTPTRRRPRHLP